MATATRAIDEPSGGNILLEPGLREGDLEQERGRGGAARVHQQQQPGGDDLAIGKEGRGLLLLKLLLLLLLWT